jgi:plastocyanin
MTMKRFIGSLAGLAVGAVLLSSQLAPAASPVAWASGSKTVTINHFEFHPHTLEVAKGTTVVFSNVSGTTHTATDRGVFDTGHIKTGHSVSVRFTHKGTFSYHCTIHPFMHGKIVVN